MVKFIDKATDNKHTLICPRYPETVRRTTTMAKSPDATPPTTKSETASFPDIQFGFDNNFPNYARTTFESSKGDGDGDTEGKTSIASQKGMFGYENNYPNSVHRTTFESGKGDGDAEGKTSIASKKGSLAPKKKKNRISVVTPRGTAKVDRDNIVMFGYENNYPNSVHR